MSTPTLSIIIPVYNGEKTIGTLLDSLLHQCDSSDVEIIVVNDGSVDATAQVLTAYNQYPIQVYNQENAGVYVTRNTALDLVTGAYIWMIDADDRIASDALACILTRIKESNFDIIHCAYSVENDQGQIQCKSLDVEVDTMNGFDFLKKNDGRLYLWNNVYSSSFINSNKLRFLAKSRSLEDSLFNLEAFANATTVGFITKALYTYVYNSASISRVVSPQVMNFKITSTQNVHIGMVDLLFRYTEGSKEYTIIKSKLQKSISGYFFSILQVGYPMHKLKEAYMFYSLRELLPLPVTGQNTKTVLFNVLINLRILYVLHFMRNINR
jgi:glycosyltransferase involved in cell wall biosynthesis